MLIGTSLTKKSVNRGAVIGVYQYICTSPKGNPLKISFPRSFLTIFFLFKREHIVKLGSRGVTKK